MVCQTADEAIDNANRQTTCEVGRCLQYVRTWLEIPSRDASATDAWNNALGKHPGDLNPPRGAPCLFTGGSQGYGHIILSKQDLENGDQNTRGTDYPSSGKVGNQSLQWYIAHWTSLHYAGWAEGINGVWIPYLKGTADKPSEDWRASGDVYVSKLHKGQQDSDSVSRLRWRLEHHDKIPSAHKPGYGAGYGSEVVDSVKYWVNNVDGQEGKGGPKDGTQLNNGPANRLFGDAYNVIEE
jgi:hypothetical protein